MTRYPLLLLLLLTVSSAQAATKIAVLNFELNDLTLAPNIPSEISRTASIRALLEGELHSAGYGIVPIAASAQTHANAGFGYLFEHPDAAADLAKQTDADYVLVGRLHKPSFLFAYLIGHLIRVANGQLIGSYTIESKGGARILTRKAVETLTVKIDQALDKRYNPPSAMLLPKAANDATP